MPRPDLVKALQIPATGRFSLAGPAGALALQSYSRDRAAGRVLPRPEEVFSNNNFGPSAPMPPYPVDVPNKLTGEADPRIWQYPVGWNLPTAPRSFEPVSFQVLRNMARVTDIIRIAIQTVKNGIARSEWGIRVKDERDAFKTKGREYMAEEKKAVKQFFEVPDRANDYEWAQWVGLIMEEVLVTDALAIYPRPTLLKGKGPLGSSLSALTVLDGTTIKPLLDTRGGKPTPPSPAYQQYLWGVPRSEFTSPQDFVGEDDKAQESFTNAELIYKPFNPRPETPWGFPPTEWAIINTITYMRRALWWQGYFTDSNLPAGFVFGGEGWSPEELERYERQLNALISGDPSWQFKIKFVPHGGSYQPTKEATFDIGFDEFMIRMLLMPYGVTPQEVGIMPNTGLGGSGMAKAQKESGDRRSLDPFLRFIASLCTRIISRYLKQPELEFYFVEVDTEDKAAKAVIDSGHVVNGIRSRNEIRDDNGWDPSEDPMADELTITTAQGITPIGQFDPKVVAQKEQAAAEQAQADGQQGHEQALEMQDKQHEHSIEETQVEAKAKAQYAPKPSASKLAEIETFERFASKPYKRPFSFKYIDPEWADRLNAALTKDDKTAKVKALQAQLAEKLKAAADALLDGEDDEDDFEEESAANIYSMALAAFIIGSGVKNIAEERGLINSGEERGSIRSAGQKHATAISEQQREYLKGFAKDIKSMTPEGIAARADLYTGTVWSGFQRGRVASMPDDTTFTWKATGDKAMCSTCDELDGQTFTEATLPFYPGESDFGDEGGCHGGPNCRCELEEVADEEHEDIAASATPDLTKYSPDQERDDHGRWSNGGGNLVSAGVLEPKVNPAGRSAVESLQIDAATNFGARHGVEMHIGALQDHQQAQMVSALDALAKDYPETMASINGIDARYMADNNVIASTYESRTNGKDSFIAFNVKALATHDEESFKRSQLKGLYVPVRASSAMQYYTTHEFGHSLAMKLLHDDPTKSVVAEHAMDTYRKEAYVSAYAHQNPAEAFAESFVAMRLGHGRFDDHPHVKAVREALEGMK